MKQAVVGIKISHCDVEKRYLGKKDQVSTDVQNEKTDTPKKRKTRTKNDRQASLGKWSQKNESSKEERATRTKYRLRLRPETTIPTVR